MANEFNKLGDSFVNVSGSIEDLHAAVNAAALSPTPKRSFLKDVAHGLGNVAKVIWQVPAARGYIATLLVRFGVPSALVAVGVAVAESLVH